MKFKANLGRAGAAKLRSDACLALGRRISNLQCGLATAARSIQQGDAAGLLQGLSVASRFSQDVERLMPRSAGEARSILTAAQSIDRELRAKKKVSAQESAKILERIRNLAKKADALQDSADKACGGRK